MPKKALIIGGLGFIGSHISALLSSSGFDLSIAYRSKPPKHNPDTNLIHLDLNSTPVEELRKILGKFNYIIFCGGADDRKIPKGDAAAFYYKENVKPCLKLVESSLDTQVEKIIILGSYFSHFDRIKPTWNLKEKHPYIKSRYLQQIESTQLSQNKIQVSILEIPYVFGAAKGMTPLWKPLVDYINKMPLIFYTKGGTNIMSVEQVAKAVLGVLNTEKYQSHWIIGSENVSWTKLIQMISTALDKKRRVILVPNFIVKFSMLFIQAYFKFTKRQSGLDPYHYIDVQTSNTFMDVRNSMKSLSYEKKDMQESINDTVRACGYTINE